MTVFGTVIFSSLFLTNCGGNLPDKNGGSNLPDNFCGKYYSRDLSGNKLNDYVEMKKDGSWAWIESDGEKCAYGKYSASHLGEWALGPDSWKVNFSIEGGKLSSYFDESQVVYYHDINQVTNERNYYRLNGVMPETGATTDFYKN